PEIVTSANTVIAPRIVGTLAMEKLPSGPDTEVNEPKVEILAPATPCPFTSITRPVTVVSGSGVTFNTTLGATPIFPPRSTAVAPKVRMGGPAGTVRLN